MRLFLALTALLALAGCQLGLYRAIDNPGKSQVVRVSSGDRIVFDLPTSRGTIWVARSDDPDVSVTVHPNGTRAEVEIRVHRGYDGPSVLTFRELSDETNEEKNAFTLSFFKQTGDVAFWE